MLIPEGYTLVPVSLYDKFMRNLEWVDIEEPTLAEVAAYVDISTEKIRADLKKYDCPLRKTYEGSRGKGNQSRFNKKSVDQYKSWLIKK
jgi:hypothetical protein